MLPEFGGTEPKETPTSPKQNTYEIQEEAQSSRYNKKLGKSIMAPIDREAWVKSVRTTTSKPIEYTADEQGTSKTRNNELFLSGNRVLVVDDTLITSKVLTTKLKKMGASEVTQTNDGEKAVRLVSEWFTQRKEQDSVNTLPFDYIFMDCQMPRMDGYEATRGIRKMEREYGVHIPIIAVTGHDPDSEEARETIKAGMDAFLDKTPSEDRIANIIREIKSKKTLK